MQTSGQREQVLDRAVATLLRPLFRVLLRNGKSFSAFEEVAKRTFVDVAMNDFSIPGKKPSISRASILSGLTRKEVQRLVQEQDLPDAAAGERHNRAARVLTGWVRDADFLDEIGRPRPLDIEGERSFATLVKRYSGDMPTRAMLDELLRVGAVRQKPDGRFDLMARGYVPRKDADEMVSMLGTDVADLIATIDHNIHGDPDAPRFQRKVMYHHIPVDALPAFRRFSAQPAQALLEMLDVWLKSRDTRPIGGKGSVPTTRVGVGIYYFEEPFEAGDTEGKAP
jgi:hypothetical protein